ncbi:MAG: LacI family DNA-binding transcriptional regulator [Clostridia bacterium]|nr:LacI family DNA-binding transcriptional regulator [Clostridia bacterium]
MKISDIAKIAGVSTATVSRVINEKEGVSAKERARVQEIIKKYDYQPNLLGQTLRNSSTNTILAIVPTLSNPFYSEILTAMANEAIEYGYALMICEQDKFLDFYIDRLRCRLVDGVVLFYSSMEAHEIDELAKKFPVVQCCEIIPNSNTSTVTIDNFQAGCDVAEMFIKNNHKRFGFVGGNAVSEQLRYEGFCEVVNKTVKNPNALIKIITKRDEHKNMLTIDFENLKSALNVENAPTAFFCTSDELAMQLVQWLQRHHYSVPSEISVIGFDDQDITKYFRPQLTTVAQDKFEIGKNTVNVLMKKINDIESENINIISNHWIEYRETVSNCCNDR